MQGYLTGGLDNLKWDSRLHFVAHRINSENVSFSRVQILHFLFGWEIRDMQFRRGLIVIGSVLYNITRVERVDRRQPTEIDGSIRNTKHSQIVR